MAHRDDIVLIGPMAAGKSTVGQLLAEALGLPQHSMDDLRWDYYAEIGYSSATEKQIREREGVLGALRYWKPFEAHAVERLLADHEQCVFDFGAGHTVYEDEALFERVRAALEPYPNVILLLPSPDLDASVRILQERFASMIGWDGIADGVSLHEHFVKHPSNHALAKHVVYTEGKTPEATCADILRLIGRA